MERDINKIIDQLNAEWAKVVAEDKRTIAILREDKRLLEAEVAELSEEK